MRSILHLLAGQSKLSHASNRSAGMAIGIGMTWSAITSNGFLFKSADFQAQSDLCFDKLQYDIWASAIGS
jgi:hypothetical protein